MRSSEVCLFLIQYLFYRSPIKLRFMFFTFFSSSKQDNSSSKSKANRAAISYCMFTKTEGNAHAQSITIICTQLFAGKLLTNQN